MSELLPLTSIQAFLFGAPLYSPYAVGRGSEELKILYGRQPYSLDGHCPFCHKASTFKFKGQWIANGTPWDGIALRYAHDHVSIECARNEKHSIDFLIRIKTLVVQKIGQFPSLADIANDESTQYRSVLSKEDSSEFHKAIGLAAHGVGIGSYVYLRRIFEHLVLGRYQEFKAENSWEDSEFVSLPMKEKIDFLKNHLPEFLVSNKSIYSILSLGIHQLSEDKCLAFFDIMKHSIIIILEEDKKNKEEQVQRNMLAKAISAFEKEGS